MSSLNVSVAMARTGVEKKKNRRKEKDRKIK
jgi:hypothetical protein